MGTIMAQAGNVNPQSVFGGTVTIKNANTTYGRMAAMRGSGKKAKKPLNYNHREISAQLMRAKRAQNAASVVTSAKRKLATLQRQAGSGQYDTKQMASAIAHARRMVRCAQLKMRNLREEEQEQRAKSREDGAQDQKMRNEIRRRVVQKERELESKLAIEQMQQAAEKKRRKNELVQKQRMHRNQERSRIQEADMKYIKSMMDRDGAADAGNSGGGGAVFDLSMEAAAMREVQMLEQAQQAAEMEAAAEMMAEMESAEVTEAKVAATDVTGGTGSASGALSGGFAGDVGAAPADFGCTVNISV